MISLEHDKHIPEYVRCLVADSRFRELHPKLRKLFLDDEAAIESLFPGTDFATAIVSDLHNVIVNVQRPAWRWLRTQPDMSEVSWNHMRSFPLFFYPDEEVNNKIRREFLSVQREVSQLTAYHGVLSSFKKLVGEGVSLHIATAGMATVNPLNIELLANLGFINDKWVLSPVEASTEAPVPIANFWQRDNPAIRPAKYKTDVVLQVKAVAEIDDDLVTSGEISLLKRLAFWVSHGVDVKFLMEYLIDKGREVPNDLEDNPYFIPCPSTLYAIRQLSLIRSLMVKIKGGLLVEQFHAQGDDHNTLNKSMPILAPGLIR